MAQKVDELPEATSEWLNKTVVTPDGKEYECIVTTDGRTVLYRWRELYTGLAYKDAP